MTGEQAIEKFYTAFANKDADAMNALYSEDISFFDPVFELLQGKQVHCMWKMLVSSGKDMKITFGNIKDLGEDYYTCDWVATYTFTPTSREVVNNVTANMKIVDGLIVEHSDGFSLHKWSKQALGFKGWLLGWNTVFRRKVQSKAKDQLEKYMASGC